MELITNVLYLLTLTGPLFQISNVIGTDRTRFIETRLLNTFYLLLKISGLFIKLSLFFVIVNFILLLLLSVGVIVVLYDSHPIIVAVVNITELLIAIYLQKYMGYNRLINTTKLLGISFILIQLSLGFYLDDCSKDYGVELIYCHEIYMDYIVWTLLILFLAVAIPLYYILQYTYFYAQTKIAHKHLVEYSKNWRKELGKTPPWPISSIERGFEAHKVYWILSGSFPLFIIYGIIIPSMLLLLVIVLLPFWSAEKLRQYLTPEKPIYMDLLGYSISAISVILLIISQLIAP